MKRLGTAFFFFSIVAFLSAQVPGGVNYQAVARDGDGIILKNSDMTVRLGIRQGGAEGTLLWQEDHEVTTNAFGLFSVVLGDPSAGKTGGSLSSFDEIDWSSGDLYLETSLDLTDDGTFISLGSTPVLGVPYAYYARSVGSLRSLEIRGPGDQPSDSALFVVRRADGQPVFAVYPEGVRVYVDTSSAKGPRGGFAIGGFGMTKGDPYEIFRVTPDSVRIYLGSDGVKRPRGGFAIGGYNFGKGSGQEYFRVTPDSVRVYIDDTQDKRPRGGFAIGGFGMTKGPSGQFFNVSGEGTVHVINPSEPRILWYPRKEAFLAGRVLIESPDSVGLNSLSIGYETKAIGQWSTAMGFKSVAASDYSLSMGMQTRAAGFNSFALGFQSQALNDGSYAFGTKVIASGLGSFAFGAPGVDESGNVLSNLTEARGDYSFAFGLGTHSNGLGSMALGANNISDGPFSVALGNGTLARGGNAVALGGLTQALGNSSLAVGDQSIARGYAAVAMGEGAQANKNYTFAVGFRSVASGENAIALGNTTLASGDYSLAAGIGSVAEGKQSIAFGGHAKGDMSMALGVGTVANSFGALVLGRYNEDFMGLDTNVVSPVAWRNADPILIVGNGTDDTNRNNAMILYKNGDLHVRKIYADLQESSDRRLKKDIRPFTGALEKILTVQPVYYSFKDTVHYPGGENIGFLAQDLERSLPEITGRDDKGYLTVKYSKMTAVLLQAVKEQQQTIEALQKKIAEMEAEKNEIAQLKKELDELRKSIFLGEQRSEK